MCQIFWANDFITSPIHVNKSPTINIKESWNLAARIGMKISEAIILTILLKWSPYVLVCFSWLLDHVIYLRLRKKILLLQAEQLHKMTFFTTKTLLSEFCELPQLVTVILF